VTVDTGGWPTTTDEEQEPKRKGAVEMVRIEESVIINRPAEETFAFVGNIENQAQWAGPVSESRKTSEGPVGVGTTYTQVTQLLGRRMESKYEVTEYEPNRKFSSKTTSGPISIHNTLAVEAVDDGTKVTVSAKVEGAGFFKLAEPIFGRMVTRQVATDTRTLKDLLEAQD
jgi:uncharacterized membrane protein